MKEIGDICRSKKIFFHTDAAQAVGKIPMDVNEMKIDLVSLMLSLFKTTPFKWNFFADVHQWPQNIWSERDWSIISKKEAKSSS